MTDLELITKLQGLKEIKPRQNWVSSVKSQILRAEEEQRAKVSLGSKIAGILDFLPSLASQRKLAYAFAGTFAIILAIAFGFSQFALQTKKISVKSVAGLSSQKEISQSAANLTNKINNLAEIAKVGKKANIPLAINEVKQSAVQLAKNLKVNHIQDSSTLQEIATSLKTLADVQGIDLSQYPEIKNSYQTIVQSLIVDFNKTTLTEDQKTTLAEVQDLYSQGRYNEAMAEILTKLQILPSPSPAVSPNASPSPSASPTVSPEPSTKN